MTGLGLTKPDGSVVTFYAPPASKKGTAVFLDSGGTLSRIPTAMFNAIGAAFPGAAYNPSTGFFDVPCTAKDLAGSVDFKFG